MAQLKSTIVTGNLQVTEKAFLGGIKTNIFEAPTASDGTIYGIGSANNVLISNGTSIYWGIAPKVTAANLTTTANAVAYYTDTAGTFGTKKSANGALYATAADGELQWGTLPVAQGGTGKTNLKDACNALINALDTGSSNLTANDYVITQYVGGGTTTTTYHRRPASALRVGGVLVSSTDNAIARFDGTTGALQNTSQIIIDDNGRMIATHGAGKADGYQVVYSTTIDFWFGVGTGNENHGIYDAKTSTWVLSAGSNNVWSFSGTAAKATNDSDGNAINTTYIKKSVLSGAYDIMYSSSANTPTRLAANTTTTKKFLRMTGTGSAGAAPAWDTVTKTDVGLSNVENTALSTWIGTNKITTVGTITTGTWTGTAIAVANGGTGATSAANARTNLGAAASDHAHGNITNGGAITTAITVGANDYIIVGDSSESGKIGKGPVFDGSTTTKCLTQKGTWESFNTYTHPSGDGNLHVPATSTTSNGYLLQAGSTAGSIAWSNRGNGRVFYGTCSTAAGTVQKDVVCDQYDTLTVGDIVLVQFANTNSGAVASLTLKVGSTDAKSIKIVRNAGINNCENKGDLYANSVAMFIYNGTYWILANVYQNSTYYYTSLYCTTAAATVAKAASGSTAFGANPGYFQWMNISYANTASTPTIGGKSVYIDGAIASSTNKTINKNIYFVYYDGTYCHIRNDGYLEGPTAPSGTNDLRLATTEFVTSAITAQTNKMGAANGYATLDENAKIYAYQFTRQVVEVTANKTLALTDDGKFLNVSSSSAITITVPTNASVAFPVGAEILVCRWGTGAVTFAAASGVTIQKADNSLTIPSTNTVARLKKIATNYWLLTFDYQESSAGTIVTVSIPVSAWSNNVATVTCNGVSATSNIVVTSDPSTYAVAAEAGVYCSAQGANSLTFTAMTATPTSDITMNVWIGTYVVTNITYAPLASPALTGTPTAPTATAGTNSTQIATTAFVTSAINGLSSTYATKANSALTGVPTAPTATAGTSTTQIATTEFVSNALANAASKMIKITVNNVSSLPQTVSNANITSDMEVIRFYLSNPEVQTGNLTVTTSSGSLTITGSLSGSTSIILYLSEVE